MAIHLLVVPKGGPNSAPLAAQRAESAARAFAEFVGRRYDPEPVLRTDVTMSGGVLVSFDARVAGDSFAVRKGRWVALSSSGAGRLLADTALTSGGQPTSAGKFGSGW